MVSSPFSRLLPALIALLIPLHGVRAEDTPAASPFKLTVQARDKFWKAIGSLDPYVMANIISPQLTGGPGWPTTRQAYLIIRREASVILATDGMSDPFEDTEKKGNGFEMELFLETNDIKLADHPTDEDYAKVRDSWAFELLSETGKLVAGNGGLVPMLDKFGVISTEFPGVSQSHAIKDQVPARFVTEDGSIGILIGQPAPDFDAVIPDTPLSKVRAVPIVLLTAEELNFIRNGGEAARKEVAAKLSALPSGFRSDLNRPSVIGTP
jgi:hypothetical protein